MNLAALGAALLALATVPQAVRLVRTRSAVDFSWGFVALHFVGLTLLAARSAEIGETAFLAVNALGVAFWGLVALVKACAVAPVEASAAAAAPPRVS